MNSASKGNTRIWARVPAALKAATASRKTTAGLVAGALLGAGGAALAEPLSLVQTLRNGENGTVIPGDVSELETNGNQVIVGSTERLQLFRRDTASGALTLADTLVDYDDEASVTAGDARFDDSIELLDSDLVIVNGARRDPTLCDVSPSCAIFGPLTLSTADNEFKVIGGSDEGDGSDDNLIVSPDGRHAYGVNDVTLFSLDAGGNASFAESFDSQFLLGDREGLALSVRQTSDGRFLFLNAFESEDINSSYLVTLARDVNSGDLSRVAVIDVAAEPGGLRGIRNIEPAPDGVTLYAAAYALDLADSGLASYAIAADGTLTQTAIDSSPNESESASLAFPGEIAVSPNGRLVLIANTIQSRDNQEALHLFTVGDDGATTWRGFEQSNRDGLIEKDLKAIESVRFSPDGAYVHVLSGFTDEGVLSTFAAHADNVTTIAAPTNALAGGDATATVRLFNAGPATAHGLVATIEASGPIGSTDRPDDCTISGSQVVCRLDELAVMGSADIAVTAATPAEGTLTFSAETVQYQTDLDESSNAATASIPLVDDPAEVDATSTTTASPTGTTGPMTSPQNDADDAGGTGGSDSSGGGCSIGSGGGAHDPLFGLLTLLGLAGFVTRRKRRGARG